MNGLGPAEIKIAVVVLAIALVPVAVILVVFQKIRGMRRELARLGRRIDQLEPKQSEQP